MATLKRINHEDASINLIQDYVEQAIAPAIQDPTVGTKVLRGIELLSGQDNHISHRLQRDYLGWLITDISAPAMVWRVDNESPTLFLTLRTSDNCVIDLKVF